jgi:hypothetical protein
MDEKIKLSYDIFKIGEWVCVWGGRCMFGCDGLKWVNLALLYD